MTRLVPVIDIAAIRGDDAVAKGALGEAVDAACTTVGFLTVAGHGVPASAIDAAVRTSLEFFDRPRWVQFSSLSWAPPVWLVPVTKSTSLWHETQASRDGVVFHESTWAPGPSWHFWQFARTDGKADFHHSALLFWKPQIA